MKLYGKNYTRTELKKYIGDISQICGVKQYVLTDGRSNGMKGLDCNTGSGLKFTVLADRCMDIAWADFRGQSITHIAKTGIVSSKYYEEKADHWFRSYFAGLMTTCGLRNTGAPCEVDGEYFGQHGRIGNIPAEQLSIRDEWIDDDLYYEISGKMREAVFYGENMWLNRTIRFKLGESKIDVCDKVINESYRKEPLFLLYHLNFGFPLINENTRLEFNSSKIDCYDEYAERGLNEYKKLDPPTHNYMRQVFMHKAEPGQDTNTISIINDDMDGFSGIKITYDTKDLPELFQFKQMGETDYQIAFEPSNCLPMGRDVEFKENRIKYIEPGEEKEFKISFEIIP